MSPARRDISAGGIVGGPAEGVKVFKVADRFRAGGEDTVRGDQTARCEE